MSAYLPVSVTTVIERTQILIDEKINSCSMLQVHRDRPKPKQWDHWAESCDPQSPFERRGRRSKGGIGRVKFLAPKSHRPPYGADHFMYARLIYCTYKRDARSRSFSNLIVSIT